MAELASGAVSSLLGLLQKEASLLHGVESDVEFIKEEMESMNSFLQHLARTAPPTGRHNKQVRTWMKQVRDLAHDCSNCIDHYLQSGDLALYRARGGLRRYFWWSYWLVQKMIARQRAAIRLRELKDRVSDVGKRRLRYGVEIPGKTAGGPASMQFPPSSSLSHGAVAFTVIEDEDEEDDDDGHVHNQVVVVTGGSDSRRKALEPRAVQDYCAEKLLKWLGSNSILGPRLIPSIAIVAPADMDNSSAIAQDALVLAAANFDKSVTINLSALHHSWDLPLLPEEVLCYILHECQQQGGTDQAEVVQNDESEAYPEKWNILSERWNIYSEISAKIGNIKIHDKIEEIKSNIGKGDIKAARARSKKIEETKRLKTSTERPLDTPISVLHQALLSTSKMEGPDKIGRSLEDIMKETALMLQVHMEAVGPEPKHMEAEAVGPEPKHMEAKAVGPEPKHVAAVEPEPKHMAAVEPEPPIRLDGTQYEDILRKVFLANKPTQAQETSTDTAATLGEDHIKEILNNHKIALDIIRKLLPGPKLPGSSSVKEQALGILQGGHDQSSAMEETEKMADNPQEARKNSNSAAVINETKEKIDGVLTEINDQLFLKGIVDKINVHLKDKKTMIILMDDSDYISQWEDIRNALRLLGCASGSAVIVITKKSQRAKEFCYPPWEPIICSIVDLYHDILLHITSQRNNDGGNSDSQIFRDILNKCNQDELCMRMFTHALYANPNRSNEELHRLNCDLQVSEDSMSINAKTIFEFSYRNLPREHKTCLLYLAVFPQDYNIKRSTLIERWAIEGLITKKDWHAVVHHANRCFDALIDRWFVMPGDLSAAGKVKSCMVGGLVHEFITKIASKENILDARLSQVRARHFSTFSGLQLRTSDNIDSVVQKFPRYAHQLRLLKLLDLEGCHCLDTNRLKNICSTILHLKYLSLRGTDVTDLPSEINNLRELEILDIRQTKVLEHATRDIVLPKLRRLLAGQTDRSMLLSSDKPLRSCVQIPRKINKMENMEVLSNVKAFSRDGVELKEIRKLWQLRKLGVVIDDKESHLKNLLWTISDLKECLHSLSITIPETRSKVNSSGKGLLPHDSYIHLIQPRKVLESLSIDGCTNIVRLLTLFAKGSNELAKVTLSRTLLEHKNLMHLAMLPKLHCVRLRHDAYSEISLKFKKEEFQHLKNFLVEQLNKTDTILFEKGAALELEKIVLFRTNVKYLCGVGGLPNLKELKLKGNALLCSLSDDGSTSETNTESSRLTFKKEEFQHLKYFLFEDPNMQTDIKFEGGAAPQLEKIVLSSTQIRSLDGVSGLGKLREIELKGERTLLSLFNNANHIAKVTLCDTYLKQHDLQILTKKPKLSCLMLLDNSYNESQLTFKEDEFPNLKLLTVRCSNISNIGFARSSSCKLEKIIWFFSKIESLSGIENLPQLKELEFNGDTIPPLVRRDIHAHNKKLIHNKL